MVIKVALQNTVLLGIKVDEHKKFSERNDALANVIKRRFEKISEDTNLNGLSKNDIQVLKEIMVNNDQRATEYTSSVPGAWRF